MKLSKNGDNTWSFLLLFVLGLLLSLFPVKGRNLAHATSLPFYDNFDTGDLSNWYPYSPYGSWSVIDKEYVGIAPSAPQKTFHYTLAGDSSWTDYTIQAKVYGDNTVDKILLFRVNDTGKAYAVNLRSAYATNDGNDILLQKSENINGGSTVLLDRAIYNNSPNQWYVIQIDVENVSGEVIIDVYINGEKVIHKSDENDPFYSGKIGLGVWPELPSRVKFNDVWVGELHQLPQPTSDPSPTPSPFLDVPDFKQYDNRWKLNIYDKASAWSNNPTINHWGCALTSAVMVLRYYNHDIFPNTLNDWLINQEDGYLRNGLINWLAVSRFSKQNSSKISNNQNLKYLEYRRIINPSYLDLDELMISNEIPIIKVPGHFFLVKGKIGTEYLVNDPASEKKFLSEIEDSSNKMVRIDKFTPSNTDLSYLMINLDQSCNFKIYEGNSELSNGYSSDEPLIDDTNNFDLSGENLSSFYLPSPTSGYYKVDIFCSEGYHLDTYIYNKDGDVYKKTITPNSEGINSVLVYIGNQPIISDVSFKTLLSDIENMYLNREIKSFAVYFFIKTQIIQAKTLNNFDRIQLSKRKLETAGEIIKKMTPSLIKKDASSYLLTKIKFLSESI